MKKQCSLVFAFAAVAQMAIGGIICSGDSASVAIDSRVDVDPALDSVVLPWNASWIGGDAGATVVITDNGTEVRRTTGAGEFALSGVGRHELTYTTYIGNVAQDEVYTATVYKDWKYELVDGGAVITETTQTSGTVTIPSEIDGYPVTDVSDGLFDGCTGLRNVTMPANVLVRTTDAVQANEWTLSPNGWTVLSEKDGEYQSATIGNDGSTTMSLELTGPYELSFDWKVSSEGGYDYLRWSFDGTEKANISGTGGDWQTVTCSVPDGRHTISWSYTKDGSASGGDDCGWVRVKNEQSGSTGYSYGTVSGLFPDSYASLQSVTLTGTATEIPPDAFAGCAALTSVTLQDGVTQIGDNCFAGCVNLETIDIPESVVRIGTNVFEACSALEMAVTNGLVLYQGWCLGFDGHAGRVTLPEGVRGIAAGAFEGEYGIETVSFPSTLRFVGARAFKDCTGIEEIVLPEGVVAVDREAFRNCTYAQELSLAETLREIGDGAFGNCALLMSVEIPDGVAEIGEVAFSNCWRMLSASIPCSVTNVGSGAFAECQRLTGVTVPLGLAPLAELFPSAYGKIESVVVNSDAQERVPPMVPGLCAGCGAMESLTLPEDLAEVSAGAFVGCTNMAAFNLPNTVTNIGARAFKDLGQLTEFAFPTGLVFIGEESFAGCAAIGSLSLPDGLQSVGTNAFRGMLLLARVDIPGSVTNVGAGAFGGCTRVRAISLPGDAATVATMFPDTYWLITSATVVNGRDARSPGAGGATGGTPVVPVGDRVMESLFEGCSALVAVEMPPSLTAIGARAFKGCSSLTAAGIPAGVSELGEEAFMGCAYLSQMALPNGLAVLPSRAFANCSSLTELTVPESVTELGANVFTGCSLLRTIRFVGNAPAYDASAYGGTDASLVTYVPNGSMGWDGVPTSRTLPEFWPDGTTHEIAWWEPNRFLVTFDPNDGAGGVATQVVQVTGTTYVLPEDPARMGSTFAGWWTEAEGGARVTAVTQVALTRPHTFYAHWTYNRYSVVFDANGGEGEMNTQEMTVATVATLPECGFMRFGYVFAGWATEPDGEVVYTNAADVLNLAYEQGVSVTLYAVWEARDWTLADYVDCGNLEFSNDAAAVWTPDSTTYKTGGASLRSGSINAAAEGGRTNTTLTATVVGAGSGSFWWKVNCEEMDDEFDEWYDYAVFTIDGAEVAKIAGNSGWRQVEYTVTGAGSHVLAWTFSRDDYDEDGATWQNCAWVDGVVWTPTPVTVTFAAGGATVGTVPETITKYEGYELTLPGAGTLANGTYVFMGWSDGETTYASGTTYVFGSTNTTLTAVWGEKVWTLGEAVDAEMLSFTTGGDADWSADGSTGWTNGVSAKSGTVTSGQSSWIETTVNGAGTLSFRWNVMGGVYRNTPFAFAKVEVDGTQQAQEYRTDGWKEQTATVEGAGAHTIRWTYSRTSSRTADGDCAWLDAVAWTPSGEVDGLSAWLAERHLAADSVAANGRTAAECYALGLDPTLATNDFRIVSIELVDGKPKVEWEPKTNRWTGAEIQAVLKGAERLEGPWAEVPEDGGSPGTARPTIRFFKVVVVP